MKKIIILISLFLISNFVSANDDFPGRDIYKSIPVIELDELYKELDNVVIIDARSQYEFRTLRIKTALSVPLVLPSKKFEKRMRDIREQHPGKKLVFYCNGHKCMKSYKAAKRCITYLKMKNIYAFDAGIFDWASKYPMDAILLGDTLKDPSKLISKADLNKRFVEAIDFIKRADKSVEILDIRDRIERDGFYIFAGYEKSISLNSKDSETLNKFFASVKKSGKPLYVYDMVGKQVRWFQYYIESKGIKEYYFMKGGANAFFKIPIHKLMD